jgi:hypothetical protein
MDNIKVKSAEPFVSSIPTPAAPNILCSSSVNCFIEPISTPVPVTKWNVNVQS